jgi:hypothetical protein
MLGKNDMAGKLTSFIKGSLDKVKKALALPETKSTDKKSAKAKAGESGKKKKTAAKEQARAPKKTDKVPKAAAPKKEKAEAPKKAEAQKRAAPPAKPVATQEPASPAPSAASPAAVTPGQVSQGAQPADATAQAPVVAPQAHSALAGTAEAAHALLEKKKAKAAKPWYRDKQRW